MMGPVNALAEKVAPAKKKKEVDPTGKVAAAVSKNVVDHTPTRSDKKPPGLWSIASLVRPGEPPMGLPLKPSVSSALDSDRSLV